MDMDWGKVLDMGENCESWVCWEKILDIGEKIIQQEAKIK